ncbi:MAG: hypothetical protein J4O05_01665 [Chloroflexi bacterium]|nr:hypothetical protein [Chloroflexota bacterium]MCI0836072.1 hypothetical protein [Chloroflexota bacterium]MCI0880790.1 hypothetical protein [Chloroflexota bacterium]
MRNYGAKVRRGFGVAVAPQFEQEHYLGSGFDFQKPEGPKSNGHHNQ